ncbi:hypothetical protein LCGC14_1180220 [marine sediment metagenome]|uniref:Uncharacterized protein n=1 Tax=marine sediment metagenome TaxID=412755 RepID=A0A0F9PST7_9ZZZZ
MRELQALSTLRFNKCPARRLESRTGRPRSRHLYQGSKDWALRVFLKPGRDPKIHAAHLSLLRQDRASRDSAENLLQTGASYTDSKRFSAMTYPFNRMPRV